MTGDEAIVAEKRYQLDPDQNSFDFAHGNKDVLSMDSRLRFEIWFRQNYREVRKNALAYKRSSKSRSDALREMEQNEEMALKDSTLAMSKERRRALNKRVATADAKIAEVMGFCARMGFPTAQYLVALSDNWEKEQGMRKSNKKIDIRFLDKSPEAVGRNQN